MSELQQLRDRIAELEVSLGLTARFPKEMFPPNTFQAPGVSLPLLGMLLAREIVPVEAAHDAIYGGLPECDKPSLQMIRTGIYCLRRELRKYGIEIKTHINHGYYLDAKNKAKILEMIDAKDNVDRRDYATSRTVPSAKH